MRTIKPRIVVSIRDGLVEDVYYEGIDLAHVELIKIDFDAEGSTAEDGVVMVGDERCFFDVSDLKLIDPDFAGQVSRAWDRWAVS